MTTPKQALIELTYDGDLRDDVADMIAGGMSWREIADSINNRSKSQHTVSHESLRQWYGASTAPAQAAS